MLFLKKYFWKIVLFPVCCFIVPAFASMQTGGVGLGATRIIYSADAQQAVLPVRNSDPRSVFLIQSWAESFQGNKTHDFIITPPLFVIKPLKENTLRIMSNGKTRLPEDRETLYWIVVKAIPAVKDKMKASNSLQIAISNRIRLLVRPNNLSVKPSQAADMLHFKQNGQDLVIKNDSPYFLSLVNFTVGSERLPNTTSAPLTETHVSVPHNARGEISFQTINDFGASTPVQHGKM